MVRRPELLQIDPENVFKTLDLSLAKNLGEVERFCLHHNITGIIGVDEAGRGPMAGPVIAGAVYLPLSAIAELPSLLNDSKKLSHQQRVSLFEQLQTTLPHWSVAGATRFEIDQLNIRQSTIVAMGRAIDAILESLSPTVVPPILIDGDLVLPNRECQVALVKGDARSLAIAAASIFAKVWRDNLMTSMDAVFPGWDFAGHKGYGTKAHRNQMQTQGRLPIHRTSFKLK